MSETKKVIAIAETSYIIRKGLVYAISHFPMVGRVVELKEMDNIQNQLNILKPDALIINPMLLGHTSKGDIRQQLDVEKKTAVIALVYNMIDEQFYRSYNAIIKINDSESKIEETLEECFNNKETQQPELDELSDREKEILVSIVRGMSNKEIADHWNISIHTVITHRRNIVKKLKIHSISGLTIYSIINKLVDISEINYKDQ